MIEYSVEWRTPGSLDPVDRRWDISDTCQDCGSRFEASGSRDFVTSELADFRMTHARHQKEGT